MPNSGAKRLIKNYDLHAMGNDKKVKGILQRN
jgi:hypothetical protein